jgi:hypothetical protein
MLPRRCPRPKNFHNFHYFGANFVRNSLLNHIRQHSDLGGPGSRIRDQPQSAGCIIEIQYRNVVGNFVADNRFPANTQVGYS